MRSELAVNLHQDLRKSLLSIFGVKVETRQATNVSPGARTFFDGFCSQNKLTITTHTLKKPQYQSNQAQINTTMSITSLLDALSLENPAAAATNRDGEPSTLSNDQLVVIHHRDWRHHQLGWTMTKPKHARVVAVRAEDDEDWWSKKRQKALTARRSEWRPEKSRLK